MTETQRTSYISHQESRALEKDLKVTLILSWLLILVGTTGYHFIENWSVLDSFYMSVITLTTVGYGTVEKLSDAGKVFTAGYILVGVVNVAFLLNTLGRTIIRGELKQAKKWRKMGSEIRKLEGHTIICGFGRLSKTLAAKLVNPVIIESNESAAKRALNLGYLVVEGDALQDQTLEAAGISKARTLFALLPSDSDNVFITLSAKELNTKVEIKARAEREQSIHTLRRAGADLIISPYDIAATELAKGEVGE